MSGFACPHGCEQAANSRWFEATGTVLFYLTPEATSVDDMFAASAASSDTTSPPHDTSLYDNMMADATLVPVKFDVGTAGEVVAAGTVPTTVRRAPCAISRRGFDARRRQGNGHQRGLEGEG